MTNTQKPLFNFKNRYIALVSHPFLETKQGGRDLFIRSNDAPKTAIVPLHDHHEIDQPPIGFVEIQYIPCGQIDDTHCLCVVTGLITTNLDLEDGQPISMSAGLERKVGKYSIFQDLLEVSIVDVPHLSGAAVIQFDAWDKYIRAIYADAQSIIKKILKELNGRSS